MRVFTLFFLLILVSCGREDFAYQEDYFQGEWRRNDTVLRNGAKYSKNATYFVMPNTRQMDAQVIISVPKDSSENCLQGRILSTDGSRYLYYNYYEIVECKQSKTDSSKYSIIIQFSGTPASGVLFDYL